MNNSTQQKRTLIINILIALFAGILLNFAFAPFYLSPLAYFCPVALFALLKPKAFKANFLLGLIFGLGFFGSNVYWVYISVHNFGNAPIPLAIIITALLILVLALFKATLCLSYAKCSVGRKNLDALWIWPSLWVIFEWILSWAFSGFPWCLLGYSQTGNMIGSLASVIGVYGVSFVCVFLGGLIYFRFKKPSEKWRLIYLISIISTVAMAFTVSRIEWTKPQSSTPLSVALVQGNIAQEDKWIPGNADAIFKHYLTLTSPYWSYPFILWPEAAITKPYPYSSSELTYLQKLSKKHQTTLLAGLPIIEDDSAYNGLMLVGEHQGTYVKRHLVPFGEYLPFEALLSGLLEYLKIPMSDFKVGKEQQALPFNQSLIAYFICYEIIFPDLVRTSAKQANLLVTINDDDWFGKSSAQAQHLQMAQMRAIETGRYLLFASNSGITAVIKPNGRISKELPPFTSDVLTDQIYFMQGETPWMQIDPRLCMLVWLALVMVTHLFFGRIQRAS